MAATETLMYPYRKGLLEAPAVSARLLFLNAEDPALIKGISSHTLIQPRFDKARRLVEAGYKIAQEPEGKYDILWILPSKDMEETQYLFALALRAAADGAVIVAAAANDAGGKRLEGLFEDLGLAPQAESKNKGRVVFATVEGDYNRDQAKQWFSHGREQPILESLLLSRPGLYGWDKVDDGSALLAEHLPSDLVGSVADFGCGWGYLSLQAATLSKHIARLTLIDVDSRAVDIAARNVQSQFPDLSVEAIWTDLTHPHVKLGPFFDTILLNPPFHAGTAADPAIGQHIITTAAQSLKPGGKLYLVANRHLPYEKTLSALFKQVDVLADEGGFKAFLCIARDKSF